MELTPYEQEEYDELNKLDSDCRAYNHAMAAYKFKRFLELMDKKQGNVH